MIRVRLTMLLGILVIALFGGPGLWADDNDTQTFTDPEKAGPDYKVQGEYVGFIGSAEDKKAGIQVIALGKDMFDVVVYQGGLPGAGWSRGGKTIRGTCQRADGKVSGVIEGKHVSIADGKMVVTDDDGEVYATLKKTVRESPTLGAKPPKGAAVLFDGSSTDGFTKGKIVQGSLLLADCESKLELGDHQLHLEFRTPFKPTARGQQRGNSGMYLQSRYEVQILDSFGLEGKNNECGGIYSIAEPIVNMCFPPLTWQTYDVDFKAAKYDASGKKTDNARVTIKHNGVVIHDDLELPHGTPGRKAEGPGPAPLYLQGHGNPVVFRNIWVVTK